MVLDVNSAYRETLRNLDMLFSYLNCVFFSGNLTTPLITMEIETENRRNIKGYFQKRSPFEARCVCLERINVNPQFFRPDKNVSWVSIGTTLLHEMIHLYARSVGQKDHDKEYHTIEFKQLAEAHGMIVTDVPDPKRGYYIAKLTEVSERLVAEFCKDFQLPLITAS